MAGLILVTSIIIVAAPVTVYLKDGGKIKGELEKESAESVTISNEYGSLEVERANIKNIVLDRTTVYRYDDSVYSFKKKTWTKYAAFASIGTGLILTAVLADNSNPAIPLSTGLVFSAATLAFIGLDYFIYGRIPKTSLSRVNEFPSRGGFALAYAQESSSTPGRQTATPGGRYPRDGDIKEEIFYWESRHHF